MVPASAALPSLKARSEGRPSPFGGSDRGSAGNSHARVAGPRPLHSSLLGLRLVFWQIPLCLSGASARKSLRTEFASPPLAVFIQNGGELNAPGARFATADGLAIYLADNFGASDRVHRDQFVELREILDVKAPPSISGNSSSNRLRARPAPGLARAVG